MAALILVAYALDALGLAIDPGAVLLVSLALLGGGFGVAWTRRGLVEVSAPVWATVGWLVVVVGVCGYFLWLARPDFLPVTANGDTVHHVSLIDYILRTRGLVHAPGMDRYLGEMTVYPAGSHILAALVAGWLNLASGLWVMQPLLAVLIALKAGFVYLITLRLLPPGRREPSMGLAAVAALLVMHGYFVASVTAWYFFSMVVAETLAIAALWALVDWYQQPRPAPLAFFSLCCAVTLLTWPTWLPILLITAVALVVSRTDLTLSRRGVLLSWALLPFAVIAVLYFAVGYRGDQGVLTNEGSILKPTLAAYGWPLLALMVVGMLVNLRNRRTLPLWVFSGATVVVLAGLWALALNGRVAYYIAYKMLYLLQYPIAIFVALALGALWAWLGGVTPPALQRAWSPLSILIPVGLVALAVLQGLPQRPPSFISEPVYRAGLWAKANLPNGCIDYVVDDWQKAYWLHVHVLGNPRGAPRADGIVLHMGQDRSGASRWQKSPDLPYAIVDDWRSMPKEEAARLKVLYRAGPAAVVQGDGTCNDTTIPIDRLPLPPRQPLFTWPMRTAS